MFWVTFSVLISVWNMALYQKLISHCFFKAGILRWYFATPLVWKLQRWNQGKVSFCFWSTSVGSNRAATEVRWCLCVTPEFHCLHVRFWMALARFCSVRRYVRQGNLTSPGSTALHLTMTIDSVCFCKPRTCSNFTFVNVANLSCFMFSFQFYVMKALSLWLG